MNAGAVYQAIGYLGSALIVVSLTRKSLLKLRLFGLAGSVVFLIYSILIGAYPIAVVNVVIIFVHLFFLRDLLSRRTEFFTVLRVHEDSQYLAYFLDFHADDIHHFQPSFTYNPTADQIRVFILRNLVPAGLFIGRVCPDGSVEVQLDFVIPQYRDFKVGRFLYSARSGIFTDPRCDRAWTEPGTRLHADYLRRMGFVAETGDDGQTKFSLDLAPLHEHR